MRIWYLCLLFLWLMPVHAELIKVGADGRENALDAHCAFDRDTNLLWEIKTLDKGLHGKDWRYSWFDSKVLGTNSAGTCQTPGRCDSDKFIADVNAEKLCGVQGWRLPTIKELSALIVCPQGVNYGDWVNGSPCNNWADDSLPWQIAALFNADARYYWTSETYDVIPAYKFYVDFKMGAVNRTYASETRGLLLVHPGWSPPPVNDYPTYDRLHNILTIPRLNDAEFARVVLRLNQVDVLELIRR